MSEASGTETELPPLLEKCGGPYVQLADWAQGEGLYPYFLSVEGGDAAVVRIDGAEKIMLGSNNYLGLTHHPRVLAAARDALDRYGSGATGSRFLTGNTVLHDALEERFAGLFGKEDALVFTTGYQANVGTVSALVGRGEQIFLDRRCHASLVDGARLSDGELKRYRHGDVEGLEEMLSASSADVGKLVVTDGVFSMDGDLAPLPDLTRTARRHGAILLVDDAHGFGVLGERGSGTAEHFGVLQDVDLVMATFSKSLASVGGVVAGSRAIIRHLRHTARSLIFSASMPPASAAGVLAALDVIEDEPELRQRLRERTATLRRGLRGLGLNVPDSETPIIPVVIGNIEWTYRFWRRLFDMGIWVHAVIPPAVPPASCIVRISMTAAHTDEQIVRVLDAFSAALRELGPEGTGG